MTRHTHTHTQVKAIFGTGKKRVAGVLVDSGRLAKGAMVEVTRGTGKGKSVVYTGKLVSLRRIKDNVDEVSPAFLARAPVLGCCVLMLRRADVHSLCCLHCHSMWLRVALWCGSYERARETNPSVLLLLLLFPIHTTHAHPIQLA